MNVVVLNESTKKAWLRFRRVLSKFLPQLGSTTWAGQLSEEGLEDLRAALKAAGVSKNTAISCLKIVGRGRMEPCWVLGSRTCFDGTGRFAFRQTQAPAPAVPFTPRAPLESVSQAVLKLAGLAHDIGKASRAFSLKLRRGSGAEVLRHEVVSFLMLAHSLQEVGGSDEAWLSCVQQDPGRLAGCASEASLLPVNSPLLVRLRTALDALASSQDSSLEIRRVLLQGGEVSAMFESAPLLGSLLWLVLTHHRLPSSDQTGQAWWADKHTNVASRGPDEEGRTYAPLTDCLRPTEGSLPWLDPAWRAAVSEAAAAAQRALADFKQSGAAALPANSWALLCAHHLRPALILADHLASQRAPRGPRKGSPAAAGVVFANTWDHDHYGDTLSEHLLTTGRLTRQVSRLCDRPWPSVELPAHSRSVHRELPPPFQWQAALEDVCRQAAPVGPVFASIIAETGAGKTLAGLRAAHALSGGKIRLTLALGLRSLTQQSAQAMVEDASLPAESLAVAVGEPQTLELPERYLAAQARRFGSESAEGEDSSFSVAVPAQPDLSWLEGFCSEAEAPELWGRKTLSLLSAPVLACTSDHLVASATMLSGGDAKLYLRLATSDLLLDEIDAYGPADLQSIGKLCFISGLHHRNVTLMSATLSPAVRNGLYAAWQQGVELGAGLRGRSPRHACVMSSNTVAPRLEASEGAVLEPRTWQAYAEEVEQAYVQANQSAPRRKACLVPLGAAVSKDGAFEAALLAAFDLHSRHHVVDPRTGVRVSVGFVRLNTAKDAWSFARHLAQRPCAPGAPEPELKFVAYHSKFPRTYLGVLDAELRQLTNRKEPLSFLETPCLREAIDQCAGPDLTVVVCTTTLIETGRDFDFDWCVLEPRSVRGEVQGTGRVLRHRRSQAVTTPNVAILDRTLRALSAQAESSKGGVWCRPGIEDDLPGSARVTRAEPAWPSSSGGTTLWLMRGASLSHASFVRDARDALPLAVWEQAIHAGPCLVPPARYEDNRIGFLEHKMQRTHLLGETSWDRSKSLPPSLPMYLRSLASLNRTHADEVPFRGKRQAQLVFIPTNEGITYFDQLAYAAREGTHRRAARAAQTVSLPPERALLPDLAGRAAQLFTGTDHHVDGCSLRCPLHQGSTKELQWHPLLGFQESSAP